MGRVERISVFTAGLDARMLCPTGVGYVVFAGFGAFELAQLAARDLDQIPVGVVVSSAAGAARMCPSAERGCICARFGGGAGRWRR